MKFNAKTILAAMAQFFTDYPERFCLDAYARDKDGHLMLCGSGKAYSFCSLGFLQRAVIENVISRNEMINAEYLLRKSCGKLYKTAIIESLNDSENGREKIIAAALEAAK